MQKFSNEESGFRDLGFSILSLFRTSIFGFRIFRKRGFSLVEVIISLAIVAVVSAIGVMSLSNFNRSEALTIETEKVISLISKARSLSLAAKDDAVYGVHFEERKTVLFRG